MENNMASATENIPNTTVEITKSLVKEMRDPMYIVFTSFADSMLLTGAKYSLDKFPPRACYYPTISYLLQPSGTTNLTLDGLSAVYNSVLQNNGHLLVEMLEDLYSIGVKEVVLTCWCRREKIQSGKVICISPLIGEWLKKQDLSFPIMVEYRDGREEIIPDKE